MNGEIDLTAEQHRLVLELIERHLPHTDVWAYGSRVKWTSRPDSDLDLVVFSGPEQNGQVADLREAFEESELPFRVDVLVWDNLQGSFQEEIVDMHFTVVENPLHSTQHLGECATLVRDTVDPLAMSSDVPYIGLGHIPRDRLAVASHGVASDVTSTKTRFRRGDILFGRLRPYFRKIARPQYNGVCSTDIWVVRARTGVDQEYLFYQMASQQFVDYATSGSEGTRMPRAQWSHVAQYSIVLPRLAEQRRIARILGTVDDKIKLNRRMIMTLDSALTAVFRQWFSPIDEKRHVPVGWTRSNIGACYKLTMGQSPPSHTYNDCGEGWPFLQGSTDFGSRFPGKRKYCTRPRKLVSSGTTLLSVRAPVGDVNIARTDTCIGRGIAGLVHESGAMLFTYYCFKSMRAMFRRYDDNGTVFGAITKKQLEDMLIMRPPPQLVADFESMATVIHNVINSVVIETAILTAIREQLLSTLISGRNRHGEVQGRVPGVGGTQKTTGM